MRVAMVTPAYLPSPGGLEGHVAMLTAALTRRGAEVTVLTQGSRRATWRGPAGEQVEELPSATGTGTYRVAPTLAWWLWQHRDRFDLVHAHSYHGAAAAMAAFVSRPLPLVLTPHFHGSGHTAFARLLHRPYRPVGLRLLGRADAVVCVSDAERRLLLRTAGSALNSKTVVIPNAPGSAHLTTAQPFAVDGPVVLSPGRLVAYKRVDVLIQAAARWQCSATLVVVGDGPDRKRLIGSAQGLAHVHILGELPRDELDRWLRSSTVVASLSTREAFGMSVLEGIVAGARIVASDHPAHREVVTVAAARERATLLALDAGPATVAAAVDEAVAAGRPRGAVPSWTWDDVADPILALYAAALAGDAPGGGGVQAG